MGVGKVFRFVAAPFIGSLAFIGDDEPTCRCIATPMLDAASEVQSYEEMIAYLEEGFGISLTPASLDLILQEFQLSSEYESLDFESREMVDGFFARVRKILVERASYEGSTHLDQSQLQDSLLGREIASLEDPGKVFSEMSKKIQEKRAKRVCEARVGVGGDSEPPFPAIWGGILIFSGALLCITPFTRKLGQATIIYGLEELGRGLSQQNEINKEKQQQGAR